MDSTSCERTIILTAGKVYWTVAPAGICKVWVWRCSTKKMFPSSSVDTWSFKEHNAGQELLFSNSAVVCRYTLVKLSKNVETKCGSVIFTGCNHSRIKTKQANDCYFLNESAMQYWINQNIVVILRLSLTSFTMKSMI